VTDVSIATDEADEARAVLVLAHGAGGDLNDPLLQALGRSLSRRGVAVVRFNFPYREEGRRAPGAQQRSEDCFRQIASSVRRAALPLYIGGKSYGGRIASHIVSDGSDAAGLVFLSYPLHPPGKPDRLRDAHLGRVPIPMLFCQGTKDPFATPQLLEEVVGRLPCARLHRIAGGDHSLRVRGGAQSDVVGDLTDAIDAFIR
jgi:predicted alpha/beta-hydrolase family hydrolase